MALLSVNNVTKRFGGLVAVDHVSFEVNQGEVISLIGPNGAGKTTVFNMLTGVYQIDGGVTSVADGILIWLEAGEKSYCLFVDELLGEQQVVVKPLPGYLNRFNVKSSGIAGCTILGDGNISIILDVSNLYTYAQ